MSKNGSKTKDFHKCCDNKGATLTIIETKNKDIFGGFTPLSWNSNSKNCYDESRKTFLFSMNLLKQYNMFNLGQVAIYCDRYYGPTFGKYDHKDIGFYEDLLQGTIGAHEDSNFFEKGKLELTRGKGNSEPFYTKEIEIFKVIIE